MKNLQRFIVEIVTNEPILTEQVDEMAENITDAIVRQCRESSVTPMDTTAYTEIVYVKGWYSEKQFIEHP